jgi:hypothetical protein
MVIEEAPATLVRPINRNPPFLIDSGAMRGIAFALVLTASAAFGQLNAGPEAWGFSGQRLDRLHQMLRKQVDDRVLPGGGDGAGAAWEDRGHVRVREEGPSIGVGRVT